jgi:hypothetical protein
VVHCSERGRDLTVGARDDDGHTTVSVNLDAVIAALVYMVKSAQIDGDPIPTGLSIGRPDTD